MKIKEELKKYREMKLVDLEKELVSVSNQAQMAVLQVKAGKGTDVAMIGKLRHSIARIKTIINEHSEADNKNE